MRELGRKGGKASSSVKPEQVSAGLRDELRNLDPKVVRAAIEQTLAGGNESARVSAVKLLADVDAFRKDGDECPRCAAVKAEGPAAREKVNEMIARLVEHAVRAEVVGETENEQNSSQATRLVRAPVRKGLVGHEEGLEAAVEAAFGRIMTRSQAGSYGAMSAPSRQRVLSKSSSSAVCSYPATASKRSPKRSPRSACKR
jgi:hypothetical protein